MTRALGSRRTTARLCLLMLAVNLLALGALIPLKGDTSVGAENDLVLHASEHSIAPHEDPEALEHRGLCSDGCDQVGATPLVVAVVEPDQGLQPGELDRQVRTADHESLTSFFAPPPVPPPQSPL